MNTCTQCSASLQPGAAFCDTCGASVTHSSPTLIAGRPEPVAAASNDQCPQCSAEVIPGQAFCEDCGSSLESLTPKAEPASVAPVAPAPAPVAPAPAPAPQVVAAPQGKTCQNCGVTNAPNYAFCDNCGTKLAQTVAPAPVAAPPAPAPAPAAAPAPVTPPQAVVPPPRPAPVVKKVEAKLVLSSNGTEFPFGSKSEILIGREDPISGIFPEVDLTYHGGVEGGVSRRHAKLMKQGEQWMAQDLKSTNHTYINRRRLTPGQPEALNHGDQLRVGRLVFTLQIS